MKATALFNDFLKKAKRWIMAEVVSQEVLDALVKAKSSRAKVTANQTAAQQAKDAEQAAEQAVVTANGEVVSAQEQASADADAALAAVRKELGLE